MNINGNAKGSRGARGFLSASDFRSYIEDLEHSIKTSSGYELVGDTDDIESLLVAGDYRRLYKHHLFKDDPVQKGHKL